MSWCGGALRGYAGVLAARRELTALAGLGALGDLDLQLLGVLQVLRRDPEARRRHLLALAVGALAGERAVSERLPPGRVLAALAGVGLGADAVHGHGERGVRL